MKKSKRIKVKVHAGSSQEKIVKLEEDEFEVWIKEKPIEGSANSYLEKFMKKELGLKMKIVSGFNSKIKLLEII